MATSGEYKSFCVCDFYVNKSVVSVQRHFRTKLGTDPPSGKSIRKWYLQFQDTGCICKRKSMGHPSTEEDRLPQRWIGHAAAGDQELTRWPPRSPDLTPCDFFLWGFIKDRVFVLPLPATLVDFRE
jgi:hypothetical protein